MVLLAAAIAATVAAIAATDRWRQRSDAGGRRRARCLGEAAALRFSGGVCDAIDGRGVDPAGGFRRRGGAPGGVEARKGKVGRVRARYLII